MRRTVLLLAAATLLAACQPPAEEPAAGPARAEEAPAPEMPADAPPQEEVEAPALPSSAATACRDEMGEAAARDLVQRCIMVSPATHPPCNVANPCAMIQGEIDRACAMYGPDETKPAECAA